MSSQRILAIQPTRSGTPRKKIQIYYIHLPTQFFLLVCHQTKINDKMSYNDETFVECLQSDQLYNDVCFQKHKW